MIRRLLPPLSVGGLSLLLAGLVLLPSVRGDEAGSSRSEIVYPSQQIPLTFSHSRHLEQGLQCVLCHGEVTASKDARDRNLPDHSVCGLCHVMSADNAADLYPPASCSTCHAGFEEGRPEHVDSSNKPKPGAPRPEPVVLPPARITFSHSLHIDRGVPCLTCHEGVPSAGLATRAHLPSMATCLSCHDGGQAPSECTTCHLQGDGGRVLTQFEEHGLLQPGGRFRPDDHSNPEWLRTHRIAAKADEASCSSCHAAAECLSCHDGENKPEGLHPADWIMTHGLEAQRRSLDCQACHELADDCQSCHSEAQLVRGAFPGGAGAEEDTGLRFHPEGWAGSIGEIPGPEHHSHTARRSLETCETCHGGADEALCLDCHARLVSPHPASFSEDESRWRYGQGEGRVCLRCHLPGDPDLSGLNR
ncbi:MAG: cytochrome c3 family protein [Myxococcota bacterium]|nr:cytochrome c3 family protein [Myxococcota bacterium]